MGSRDSLAPTSLQLPRAGGCHSLARDSADSALPPLYSLLPSSLLVASRVDLCLLSILSSCSMPCPSCVFFVCVTLLGMWNLSSPVPLTLGAWSPNHWTTREVPSCVLISLSSTCPLSSSPCPARALSVSMSSCLLSSPSFSFLVLSSSSYNSPSLFLPITREMFLSIVSPNSLVFTSSFCSLIFWPIFPFSFLEFLHISATPSLFSFSLSVFVFLPHYSFFPPFFFFSPLGALDLPICLHLCVSMCLSLPKFLNSRILSPPDPGCPGSSPRGIVGTRDVRKVASEAWDGVA